MKSAEHRVLANDVGPRISVACFFSPSAKTSLKLCGPIKELLSEENPPKFRDITFGDYEAYYLAKGLDGTSALTRYRIWSSKSRKGKTLMGMVHDFLTRQGKLCIYMYSQFQNVACYIIAI